MSDTSLWGLLATFVAAVLGLGMQLSDYRNPRLARWLFILAGSVFAMTSANYWWPQDKGLFARVLASLSLAALAVGLWPEILSLFHRRKRQPTPESPLRTTAANFVRSVRAYRKALDGGGQTDFLKQRCSRLLQDYYVHARESDVDLHRYLADEIEDLVASPEEFSLAFEGSIAYQLQNWLRAVPSMVFGPTGGTMVSVGTAPDSGTEKHGRREYVSGRVEIRANQTMPQPLLLRVELDTEIEFATVSLRFGDTDAAALMNPGAHRPTHADVAWCRKTAWLSVEEPQLSEGDLVELSVASQEGFTPPVDVQIATTPQVLDLAIDPAE